MCDKAIDDYACALEIVPDWYKTQEMCDKAVDDYPSTIQFVPECFKTQKICDKAVTIIFMNGLYILGILKQFSAKNCSNNLHLYATSNTKREFR